MQFSPRQAALPLLCFVLGLFAAVCTVTLLILVSQMKTMCAYFNPNPQGMYGMPMDVGMPIVTGSGASWNPDQAAGAPDTPQTGDFGSAWASLGTDDKDEWLELEYAEPVMATSIIIHENFNPGAVSRVTAFDASGKEVKLWEGKDPFVIGDNGVAVATIPVDDPMETQRIKVYIASTKVLGWNEIDAVGITDELGGVHWATSAIASSTFANPGPIPPYVDPYEERLKKIEQMLETLTKKR